MEGNDFMKDWKLSCKLLILSVSMILILTSCGKSKVLSDNEIIDLFVDQMKEANDERKNPIILPGINFNKLSEGMMIYKDFGSNNSGYEDFPEWQIKVIEIRSDLDNNILKAHIEYHTISPLTGEVYPNEVIMILKKYDQGWKIESFDNKWE